MYEFWNDFVKSKYREKNVMLHWCRRLYSLCLLKTEGIYPDIAKDAEARFDTSNCDLVRPLLKEKNKKVIGLLKDELDGEIMREFASLTTKACTYLTDNNDADKKQKAPKKLS